jgi:hypothetical protein
MGTNTPYRDLDSKDDFFEANLNYGADISIQQPTGLIMRWNVKADPLLDVELIQLGPSTDSSASFRLQSGSPAIGIGMPFSTAESDIGGNTITAGAATNRGAYFANRLDTSKR